MEIADLHKVNNGVIYTRLGMKIVSCYQKVSKSPKKFQKNPAKRLTYFRYVVQLKA